MTSESLLTDADAAAIAQFLNTVKRAPRSALLLDYDGTLAPFVVNREQAFPYKGVTARLCDIMMSGRTRVVIISGRNAYDVVSFLRLAPFPEIWGSHGLQRLKPDGSCEMPHVDAMVSDGLSAAGEWVAKHGMRDLAEFKPGAVAFHWRGQPESSIFELRREVLRAWSRIACQAGLSVLEFDGGIEIRIPKPDKGDAVRTILKEMGAGTPIAYLGDDVTDENAFTALANYGMSVLVRPERRKTQAQLWLKPPDDVLEFLAQWRQACA